MSTPINCPNCGSTLAPGVAACARCGYKLIVEPTPEPAAPSRPQFPRPATAVPPPATSLNLGALLTDARERWNVKQTPYLSAAIALGVLALLVGTLAHISYLTAGSDEGLKKDHDFMWLVVADGLAFAAAVVALVVRRESGPTHAADFRGPDFRIGAGLVGITVLFSLVGVVIGMGGRGAAEDSWTHYSQLFAFLALAWLIISRPVPAALGTVSATTLGLVLAAAGVGALLVGQISGMRNSNDSYFGGVAWQAMGIAVITLALGWFLGMAPRSE
jgi:DNA-directed RNA polymerase subunit RPC12/RpoP